MTDSPLTETSTGVDASALAEASDRDVGRSVSFRRHRNLPELLIASHSLARLISGVAAVMIAVGSVFWAIEAGNRLDVPDAIRPAWFRATQFGLAAAGIVAAGVELVYLAYFAMTGYIWRRWRLVTVVFSVLASAWTALWLLDRFVLDGFFLD